LVALFTIALLSGRTRTALLRQIADRGAWSTNLRYLHGLCPCPVPSSVSSPADVRVADQVCYAVCTSLVPPAISSSSATKIFSVQEWKSLTESFNKDVTIFIESFINAKDTIRSSAVNPITEIYRIYSSKIFTGRDGFYLLDRFPRKSIGNEGLLATERMVDGG